jgi:hypothetical protein
VPPRGSAMQPSAAAPNAAAGPLPIFRRSFTLHSRTADAKIAKATLVVSRLKHFC